MRLSIPTHLVLVTIADQENLCDRLFLAQDVEPPVQDCDPVDWEERSRDATKATQFFIGVQARQLFLQFRVERTTQDYANHDGVGNVFRF